MSKNATPRWQNPNKPIPPKDTDPAATPIKSKAKPGRNYLGDAIAALTTGPSPDATSVQRNKDLLSAIIVAQALDRFGEQLVRAAAVNQYKRAS